MSLVNDELELLIKSQYPLVFVESVDEEYVLAQLARIARQLNLTVFQWSVTEGLRKEQKDGSYYRSPDPVMMLKTVLDIVKPHPESPSQESLFIFKDLDKHLFTERRGPSTLEGPAERHQELTHHRGYRRDGIQFAPGLGALRGSYHRWFPHPTGDSQHRK